jgi:hypothetical protein
VTGYIRRSEWDRMWAEARARGTFPPFICKAAIVPDAEYDAHAPSGVLAWLGKMTGRHPAAPEREPEAGL